MTEEIIDLLDRLRSTCIDLTLTPLSCSPGLLAKILGCWRQSSPPGLDTWSRCLLSEGETLNSPGCGRCCCWSTRLKERSRFIRGLLCWNSDSSVRRHVWARKGGFEKFLGCSFACFKIIYNDMKSSKSSNLESWSLLLIKELLKPTGAECLILKTSFFFCWCSFKAVTQIPACHQQGFQHLALTLSLRAADDDSICHRKSSIHTVMYTYIGIYLTVRKFGFSL